MSGNAPYNLVKGNWFIHFLSLICLLFAKIKIPYSENFQSGFQPMDLLNIYKKIIPSNVILIDNTCTAKAKSVNEQKSVLLKV
jgi:hypothetical protein